MLRRKRVSGAKAWQSSWIMRRWLPIATIWTSGLRFLCSRSTTPKGSSFQSSSWPAWRKDCFRTWARYRRRWGGGETEASIPSRFLGEVPEALVQDLSPRKRTGQVDLYGERQEVREAARRNLYTGKTYNSVE